MDNQYYGAVEAGGTKFICCVATAAGEIVARTEIATTDPQTTLRAVGDFFAVQPPVAAVGIGSFGPLELNDAAAEFGYITNTPKAGWQNTNLKGFIEDTLNAPVYIDTDVNCAALGELHFGLAKGHKNFIYITVGTGIGGSLFIDGRPYHGASHLEVGHMRVQHELFTDDFVGVCPFHADCLEGIASGTALEQRWGTEGASITDPRAWELEAQYIGMAIANLTFITRPELIILGGGVMNRAGLIDAIQAAATKAINGYVSLPPIDQYVVATGNTNNAVLGAVVLATDGKLRYTEQ